MSIEQPVIYGAITQEQPSSGICEKLGRRMTAVTEDTRELGSNLPVPSTVRWLSNGEMRSSPSIAE